MLLNYHRGKNKGLRYPKTIEDARLFMIRMPGRNRATLTDHFRTWTWENKKNEFVEVMK